MQSTPVRPGNAPTRYIDTEPFWRGARDRRLLLQYCPVSGRYQHFPRPGSIFTAGRKLEWREASGRGTLVSWTVSRVPPPGFKGETPRVHALVDLAEGVRMLSWLVACETDALRTGMALRVAWVALDESTPWPAFTPVRE